MYRYSRPVTPAEESTALKSLVEELVPGGTPFYVEVCPQEEAPPNECFLLVDEHVSKSGGEPVNGWALWEFPTQFVEAEFHCVWRNPEGSLVDVTPKPDSCERILFLPEPNAEYMGVQVDNLRRGILKSPVMDEYLKTFSDVFSIMNEGDRAREYGEIKLKDEEARRYHEIMERQARCFQHLSQSFPYAGPYLPCPCGSGKKIKWCHKEYLRKS